MNNKKKEKQKKNLVELGLMDPDDTLVDFFYANYLEKLAFKIGSWERCWLYFTEQRLICMTGILESNIVIPYRNIQKIEKCSQGLFPMGIAVTYRNPETGEAVLDKFSMTKRKKWIEFLSEKSEGGR